MRIYKITSPYFESPKQADEINWCSTFGMDNVGWPPTGYEYFTSITYDRMPAEGYSILGPAQSEIGRIYFHSDTQLFEVITSETGSSCFLMEGGILFAINNAIMVRDLALHIAKSPSAWRR